jgi:hypothetical protein
LDFAKTDPAFPDFYLPLRQSSASSGDNSDRFSTYEEYCEK